MAAFLSCYTHRSAAGVQVDTLLPDQVGGFPISRPLCCLLSLSLPPLSLSCLFSFCLSSISVAHRSDVMDGSLSLDSRVYFTRTYYNKVTLCRGISIGASSAATLSRSYANRSSYPKLPGSGSASASVTSAPPVALTVPSSASLSHSSRRTVNERPATNINGRTTNWAAKYLHQSTKY